VIVARSDYQITYLPLRFRRTDDGDLSLGLLLSRLILFERCDLHARAGESNDIANVGALSTDDGADAVVGNVEKSRLLNISSGDTLLARETALVGIWGGS